MSQRRSLVWFHCLFAFSGAAGLGLQLAWTRMLAFGLGHEAPATFGVVTAFLFGLAAGAWLLDRWGKASPNAATRCAWLEGITALWAVATLWVIPALVEAGRHWVGPAPAAAVHWGISLALPALALLPATLAMGATLPAVESLLSGLRADGRRVGPLYAANTFGAVAGVVSSVWILQPAFGLRGTTLVFAAVNGLCGIGFLLAGRGRIAAVPRALGTPGPAPSAAGGTRGWATLFATGLIGIGFEILSVRLLGQALENTVYTYASILAVYLLGTAAGAALRNRLAPDPVAAIPVLLLALGGAVAVAGFVLVRVPEWHPWLRAALGEGAAAVATAELLTSAAVVAPATFLMGLLFSSLVQAARSPSGQLGRAVAWNTLGGALGPAVVGLGLVPWIGSRWTLVALAAGYLLLLPRVRGFQWMLLAAVVVGLAFEPAGLHLQRLPSGARTVAMKEGPGDTVSVIETADHQRALRVNNRFTMGGTASANAERRHGHIPLLLHPDPRRALFLGYGTGISFASMGTHPGVASDGVELVPEIVGMRGEFAPHNAPGAGQRIHVADARRFVRASTTEYDVVIADLFHPARDGAGGLYTREQFQAIRARLSGDGLFCQWLPLFQLDLATLRTITRTFLEVFPDGDAFLLRFNADTPVLGLVGGRHRLQFDAGWYGRRTADPALREALKPLVLSDPWQFFGTWFADAAWLRELSADAPVNTDDRPVVLFQAPRTLTGHPVPGYALLEQLLDRARPAPDGLFTAATRAGDRPWLDRLVAFQKARDGYLRGLIADASGRRSEAEGAFLGSVRTSADFTSGYSQLLARATQQARTDPAAARRLLELLEAARPERPVARELRGRLGL